MTAAQAQANYRWRRAAFETRHGRPATRFAPPRRASGMRAVLVAAWDLLTRP